MQENNALFKLLDAEAIANDIIKQIEPHCYRCQIAGSIRRKKSLVKDIEIVAIPKPYEVGLFADGLSVIVNQWPKIKGEMQYGKTKYTQRMLPQGIKLDLFFAEPGNWGLILAIRTGSAEYSHKVLATAWAKLGYESQNGYLTQNGKVYQTPEEKDVFSRIGVPYIQPEYRN